MILKRITFMVAGIFLLVSSMALAQTGGSYDLSWWTVDGGGGRSANGPYVLSGTAGQPDVGRSTGGSYTLEGGFWGGSSLAFSSAVYLPLIIK